MKSTQDSGSVSETRHIFLFLCLLASTDHQPSIDCDFAPLAFWLLEHAFLFEWWVIPTINFIDDTTEDTFIDRKSCKSLLASHLRLLSPEIKACFFLKCSIEFQDISPLVYPVLQKHCRTSLHSHMKDLLKTGKIISQTEYCALQIWERGKKIFLLYDVVWSLYLCFWTPFQQL